MRSQDPSLAKKFKGARWLLTKNPENLSDKQELQLDQIRRSGGAAWRAYTHKEAVRSIFHGDLTEQEASELIDRAISRCQRSRLQPFVKLCRTLREHEEGTLASIRLGISNARAEALNTKVHNIIRRAYGFYSAEAAIALVMLACGPIELRLFHEKVGVLTYIDVRRALFHGHGHGDVIRTGDEGRSRRDTIRDDRRFGLGAVSPVGGHAGDPG